MQKNLTAFFATKDDLLQLIGCLTGVRPLQFVVGGLFDSSTIQSMLVLSNPDPTINYLVADRDLVIQVRVVSQRNGNQKFAIDQFMNPKTIALRAGGLIEDHCLIAGQVGTTNDDQISLGLYKWFSTEMRKRFSKIKSYYVGAEALRLLDSGVRLTHNPKAPPLYDLTRT